MSTIISDPIVDEIRRIRQQHTDRFSANLHAICEDLRRQEVESGRRYVSFPPRRAQRIEIAEGLRR